MDVEEANKSILFNNLNSFVLVRNAIPRRYASFEPVYLPFHLGASSLSKAHLKYHLQNLFHYFPALKVFSLFSNHLFLKVNFLLRYICFKNVVLFSSIQQSKSVIYLHTSPLF